MGDLNLNIDAGYPRAESMTRCVMVVRDYIGVPLLSVARCFLGITDVLQAKLNAMSFGLELVCKRGLQVWFAEPYSLLVVCELKKVEWSMLEWYGLLQDIRYWS